MENIAHQTIYSQSDYVVQRTREGCLAIETTQRLSNYSTTRAETKKQEGSRKRGRPQLRWDDCVKRDLRKAEEEEKLREKANNRDRRKQIAKVAVLRSDQPHPYTRETRGKTTLFHVDRPYTCTSVYSVIFERLCMIGMNPVED